jgi:hypothetical protein
VRRAAVVAFLPLLFSGCQRPALTVHDAGAAFVDAGESVEGELFASRRCGECHGREREEWSQSAHARAASAPAYLTALEQVPAEKRQSCLGCHLPLEAGGPRVAADGVGCDACHTATAAGAPPKMLTLSPVLATRFGPYRDARDHHFHRMGFSDFVTGNGLCIACHQDPPTASLPVYTTVAEWQTDADAPACNSCHMPSFKAVAAKGEKLRSVSRHDFSQDRPRALAEAIELELHVSAAEAKLELTNTGAAHALPTGRPERRLRLELEWQGRSGLRLASEERLYGRVLVGADGLPAPSFLAQAQGSDVRLFRGKALRELFPRPKAAAWVSIRLWYEPFDSRLAKYFEASTPVLILERREALDR